MRLEVAVAEERISLCATAIGVVEDVVGVVPFEARLAALVIELELESVLVLEIAAILVCASGVVVLMTAGGAVVVAAAVDVI